MYYLHHNPLYICKSSNCFEAHDDHCLLWVFHTTNSPGVYLPFLFFKVHLYVPLPFGSLIVGAIARVTSFWNQSCAGHLGAISVAWAPWISITCRTFTISLKVDLQNCCACPNLAVPRHPSRPCCVWIRITAVAFGQLWVWHCRKICRLYVAPIFDLDNEIVLCEVATRSAGRGEIWNLLLHSISHINVLHLVWVLCRMIPSTPYLLIARGAARSVMV